MQLNHKSLGQGPALVILHGLLGSLDNWISIARKFEEAYNVYLIDLRNHGRSPHSAAFNYPVMAQDIADFLEEASIYQCHLLGHSMGGKVAMQVAKDFPDLINKLIVADIGPKAYTPHHNQVFEALLQVKLDEIQSRKEADQAMQRVLSEVGVRQFLLKSLKRDESGRFDWKFNLNELYKQYQEVIVEIELDEPFPRPSLFVHGGKSDYVLPEDKAEILIQFPAAIFQEIPNAGHWLHAEAPEPFYQAVAAFLAS